MSRLDANGFLNDYSVSQMERMAFDHAMPAPSRARPRVKPERVFTVAVDTALRAAAEQRAAADHERAESPIARAIPGYHRLP